MLKGKIYHFKGLVKLLISFNKDPCEHTGPDDVCYTLGAITSPSLSCNKQDEHLSTGQIRDVAIGVRRCAAGGVSVDLLQRCCVDYSTRNG